MPASLGDQTVRVLVVEDTSADSELVRMSLARAPLGDFELVHASRLVQAEQVLDGHDVDLVLLDLGPPDWVGMETLERFRRASDLPIVVMTGLGDDSLALDAISLGADDYVAKSNLSPMGLARTLLFAIERRQTAAALTELKDELEERVILRTAELEEANADLKAFSYSVSHDLRGPLRAVDGFSQVLFEEYGPVLDEAGRDYLGRLRRASARMSELVDGLLRLFRLSRQPLEPSVVDLSAFARDAVDELVRSQPDRVVTLSIEPDIRACGDGRMLRLVVDNLIGNAWKFTAESPEAHIWFGQDSSGDESVYYVRDNGVGFDSEAADRLFGAFERFHARGRFEGGGLGLATVQRVIRRHGGRVWAVSGVDQGATFFFTL